MLTSRSRTLETLRGRYDPHTDTGYMGYVPASDFITGAELVNLLDFREGIDQNSNVGWLRFYVGPGAVCNQSNHERILLISKKSLKHTVSWDQINSAGLVYGGTSRTILGQSYRVRIMTGGESRSSPGTGSEWNELICRVHEQTPESIPNWETFDTIETNITSGDGRYVWCQETPPSNPTERVGRGGGSLTNWIGFASSGAASNNGWRPVLELVR